MKACRDGELGYRLALVMLSNVDQLYRGFGVVIFVWVGLSVSLAERSCDAVPASQRIGTPYWYAPLLDAVICCGDLHVYDFGLNS